MSVNPYSYKPASVFKALDKNKDGRIDHHEIRNFKKSLAPKYQKAHQFLSDLEKQVKYPKDVYVPSKGTWIGQTVEPTSFTLDRLVDIANSGSANGLLNPDDFK